MINPRAMRSKKAKRLHLKVRLVKRGKKPTRNETIAVVDALIAGNEVPDGWEFYAIDWEHPKSSGSGNESDVQAFRGVLLEMRDEMLFGTPRKVAG